MEEVDVSGWVLAVSSNLKTLGIGVTVARLTLEKRTGKKPLENQGFLNFLNPQSPPKTLESG